MSENAEIVKAEPKSKELTQIAKMYGTQEQIEVYGNLVRKFAPWSEGMTDKEVEYAIRRVVTMGLDPLAPHEVQIWKDNRRVIQVQHSYTLIIEWVKKFKGEHTSPIEVRLTEDELLEEGLPPDAVAYRCSMIMTKDLDRMQQFLNMSKDADLKTVMSLFQFSGIGVSLRKEYDGEYFAPAGRSKSWKVKKRAKTDAYRHKFGTPTRKEIVELRRDLGWEEIQPEDWAQALEVGADERGTLELAKDSARRRNTPALSREEAKDGANALFGNDDGAVEGVFKDVPEDPETPEEPDPEQEPVTKSELHWICLLYTSPSPRD